MIERTHLEMFDGYGSKRRMAARDRYHIAELYLQNAQDAISRSFHELLAVEENQKRKALSSRPSACISRLLQNSFVSELRRRKSVADFNCLNHQNSHSVSRIASFSQPTKTYRDSRSRATLAVNPNFQEAICPRQFRQGKKLSKPNIDDAFLQRTNLETTKSLYAINVFEENPIPRRKRFIRRKQRDECFRRLKGIPSRSISALDHDSPSTSDSDADENTRCRVKNTLNCGSHPQICHPFSESEVLKEFSVSSRNLEVSLPSSANDFNYCRKSSSNVQHRTKGPSARRAERYIAAASRDWQPSDRIRSSCAKSDARLDSIVKRNITSKESSGVRRSMSVKDLNGRMIDFMNQDSVVRWTSQILDELNSLPSSRADLTQRRSAVKEVNSDQCAYKSDDTLTRSFSSGLSEKSQQFDVNGNNRSLVPPPVPPHRHLSYVSDNNSWSDDCKYENRPTNHHKIPYSMASSFTAIQSQPMYYSMTSVLSAPCVEKTLNFTEEMDQSPWSPNKSSLTSPISSDDGDGTPHVRTPEPTREIWPEDVGSFRRRNAADTYRNEYIAATPCTGLIIEKPSIIGYRENECTVNICLVARPTPRTVLSTSVLIVKALKTDTARQHCSIPSFIADSSRTHRTCSTATNSTITSSTVIVVNDDNTEITKAYSSGNLNCNITSRSHENHIRSLRITSSTTCGYSSSNARITSPAPPSTTNGTKCDPSKSSTTIEKSIKEATNPFNWYYPLFLHRRRIDEQRSGVSAGQFVERIAEKNSSSSRPCGSPNLVGSKSLAHVGELVDDHQSNKIRFRKREGRTPKNLKPLTTRNLKPSTMGAQLNKFFSLMDSSLHDDDHDDNDNTNQVGHSRSMHIIGNDEHIYDIPASAPRDQRQISVPIRIADTHSAAEEVNESTVLRRPEYLEMKPMNNNVRRPSQYSKLTSPLAIWKRRAENRAQRAPEAVCPSSTATNSAIVKQKSTPHIKNECDKRRSVHNIVASLIRAAEETRFRSTEKSTAIVDITSGNHPEGTFKLFRQEAGTQTSPSLSLSRSSSFDWIHDPVELIDIAPSPSTAESEAASGGELDSSSGFDTRNLVDTSGQPHPTASRSAKEVRYPRFPTAASETRLSLECPTVSNSDSIGAQLMPNTCLETLSSSDGESRTKDSHQQIDESIAMLLEYAENLSSPVIVGRHQFADVKCANQYCRTDRHHYSAAQYNDGSASSSPNCASSPSFSPHNQFNIATETSDSDFSVKGAPRRRVKDAFPHQIKPSSSTTSVMSESVYDNVQGLRRATESSSHRKGEIIEKTSTESSPSPVLNQHPSSSGCSREMLAFSSPSSTTATTVYCRRMAVRQNSLSSGLLADSEGSPLSPSSENSAKNITDSQVLNPTCNTASSTRSTSNKTNIGESRTVEGHRSRATNTPSESPPPPSPSTTLTKNSSPCIVASDLFTPGTRRLSDRAGSCEQICIETSKKIDDDLFSIRKQKAEEEAAECCRWLRDAGFPQYAQQYEDQRFPIDIRSVQQDHEFLDSESLRALYRRLNALNRCAIMKVENVVLRRHAHRVDSEGEEDMPLAGIRYNDDEDEVAISNHWKFQRKSQTWSRVVSEEQLYVNKNSPLQTIDGRHNAEILNRSGWSQQTTPMTSQIFHWSESKRTTDEITTEMVTEVTPPSNSVTERLIAERKTNNALQRSQSERIKERAKAFMKRMDIRSSSRRRKQRQFNENNNVGGASNINGMVIGDPVLVSHFSASPRALRMFPNGISGLHNNNNNNNSSSTPSNAVHNVNTSYGFGDRRRYPSEAHLSNDVSIAVVPTKDPIHHHSHHHQPQQQQQQQPSSNTSYNVSPFPRSRAFPVRLGRSAKLNRHRMGMFIPSPTSDSSSDDEFSKPSRPIHMQRRPRDLSCDPAIMRGVNRRPSFESRIYDRVAVDDSVFPFVPQPKQAIRDRESKRLQRYVVNNHAESPLNSALSYCPTYAFSNSARSASSQRRNCVRTAQMSAANIPTRNLNGVRPPSETATVESLGVNRIEPTEIYNLSDHCRLVVNSDGYYDHISSDHQRCNMDTPSSRASTVRQSSTNLQRGISPVSSGSTGSTSNILHRLRVDIDMHGRRQASSVSPSSIGPKNTVQQSHSSLESSGNDDDARQGATGHGERRDSGVGSSLSRSPSGPTTQRVRNSRLISTIYTPKNANTTNSAHRNKLFNYNILSYEDSHINGDDETFICDSDLPLCMDALSVGEMLRLRKLAFLKLSVLLDRYGGGGIRVGGGSNINSNPTVKNWAMLKLMKRIRNPENKVAKSSVSIFGLPLAIVQSKTAHALPKSILEVMQFLRVLAPETIGIFRKNGVRSRIMELRAQCDSEEGGFTNGVGLDPLQVHDIADMLKQYFRELPEPLMTTKFSETFANIFLYVPRELRMEALQYAVLLLPDENREALQTLLFFLKDVSKHAATNSMTSQNLALCFAPSLFQLTTARLNAVSPTRRHKTIGAAGMPTEKEMKESRAAQECLCVMIENCCKLFLVPHNNVFEHSNNVVGYEPDAPCLTELGVSSDGNYKTYLMQKARELLKEHRDRWKGWIVEGSVDGVEISSKKSPDGHPLRYYRVWVDVEALPKEVLLRLTKERHIWDVRVINWRRVAQLSADSCDVFQYVLNDMPSHATRDVVVVRFWRVDMKELRGGCVLVERSVRSSETQLLGGVSAAVLSSRFLIEPNAGRSRVTYVSRIDLRGRSNVWYNRVFGQLVARQLCRLRDSFGQMAVDDDGPETKV